MPDHRYINVRVGCFSKAVAYLKGHVTIYNERQLVNLGLGRE
jgi:hypothetical protein